MRGRASVFARAGRLEESLARRPRPPRPRHDFSALDDRELDDLASLAEKAEAAGGNPDWTAEELAVLERLGAKLAAAVGTHS